MDEKIRIAKLIYTFDVETAGGGVSLYATELGAQFDPQRFDVRLYSLGYFDSPQARKRMAALSARGCRTFTAIRWDSKHAYQSLLRAFLALRRRFTEEPVDVLHTHSEYTDIVALMLKLSGKARRIMRTIHAGHQHEWVTRPVIRMLLTNFLYPIFFDMEVAINQANIDRLDMRWMARLLRKRAEKIYNAISLERFTQASESLPRKNDPALIALKNTLGIPENALVIGSVGRLADQKGYCYLLEAATILVKQLPEARFLIVGDGNLHIELVQQTQKLGIAQQVIFTGARNDVDQLLQCMDVFVSSSLWEGLPTVIMEAMASQLPIVATDIPGTRELVQQQVNGILVPPANPEPLAQAILEVLNSPQLSQRLVQGGLAILPDFSIERVAKEYEELYVRLVRKADEYS
jgi:glycosyltransferase involved in cell wall biosynthesis